MRVIFTKTGARRYRVAVEGPGIVPSQMEPAAGFDELLPHDMAHFVVENELGIPGGVFGQLAGGGNAGTFHPLTQEKRRKLQRRGERISRMNRRDANLSEQVVYVACSAWKNKKSGSLPGVASESIARICKKFDEVSELWSKLQIGESLTLDWRPAVNKYQRARK